MVIIFVIWHSQNIFMYRGLFWEFYFFTFSPLDNHMLKYSEIKINDQLWFVKGKENTFNKTGINDFYFPQI